MAARKRNLTLQVKDTIEVEPGLNVPPGRYSGSSTEIAIYYMGQQAWTDPDYSMSLSADQIREMGANPGTAILIDFNVTRFVAAKKIIVI